MKKVLILILIGLLLVFKTNNKYIDNYINNDVIGKIYIKNKEIDLLQGLDDEYYMIHNKYKSIESNNTIFIGYETDLNKDNNNILYMPYNKQNELGQKDIIRINYLGLTYEYVVNNTKNDLEINYYNDTKIVKKLKCKKL